MDVNVPQDKAFTKGGGPAGYEAVFGSYDIAENRKKARSYARLCINIRRGHAKVPVTSY